MATDPLAACVSPSERAWPAQYLEFQREITSDGDPVGQLPNPLTLQGQSVNATVRGSILAWFSQQWTLEKVMIGDYANLVSLAPGEILTIEVKRTQHTLLEQTQESTSTVEDGTENLDSDKESITVANTSARTANWSISGTGGFSLAGIGASGSATDSNTVNNSTSNTLNSIHETTVKSTQKVTTQTKLQVRGVTETTVEARQTRILKNPFQDRALDLNLYEVVKKFQVQTSQESLQLLITTTLQPITFNQAFVSSNQAFLNAQLLDSQLLSALPTIVSGLEQAPTTDQAQAINDAIDTLERYLFEERPGFQPYHVSSSSGGADYDYRNDTPANAFTNYDLTAAGWNTWTHIGTGASGVAIGLSPDISAAFEIYLNLHMYYMLMGAYPSDGGYPPGFGSWASAYPTHRLELMRGLAQRLDTAWNTTLNDSQRIALMKGQNRTEIFRRVPGFLKLYQDLLGSVVVQQPNASTVALTSALINHLNVNADYYTEQYLRFLWDRLGSTLVIRLTNDILSEVFPAPAGYSTDTSRPYLNLYQLENVHRAGLSIHIPLEVGALPNASNIPNFLQGLTQLNNAINNAGTAAPLSDEVIVPTEGIHLESVAGACVLQLPSTGGGGGNGDSNGDDGSS
jgi:hypothetical protein